MKFSHEHSTIEVIAKTKDIFVDIQVRDHGVGMTPEEMSKVMDKNLYFSNFGTKQEKGTGIGLQLCFEFIKANNGIYRIESEKGKGTNFIFSLPKG